MYKYYKRRVNKGYVLIYVLLVGSICLLSSIFVFKMEMDKRASLVLYKEEVTSSDKLQQCRENLLTDLDSMINVSLSSKDISSIKAYLSGLPVAFKSYYQNFYISYDKTKDKIFIDYYINEIYYKTEYFNYYVDSAAIKYKCSEISYVKGMIN